jgi:hypothetical protein
MKNRSFTLIELIVTLVLVTILTSVAVVGLQRQRDITNELAAKQPLETVLSAEESFRNIYGRFANAVELKLDDNVISGIAQSGQISVHVSVIGDTEWLGLATPQGSKCITLIANDNVDYEPKYSTYQNDQSECSGSFALGKI